VLDSKRAQQCEYKAKIQGVLKKATTNGQLPPDTDVVLAQQTIGNFMSGTMREWLFAPQAYRLDASAPAMENMLLAGLVACPPLTTPLTAPLNSP
jgi:hypothetical protein